MRRPARLPGSAGGFVASEFVLGVCVMIVPATLIVLLLPTWSERQAMAQRAANESAREVAIASSWSAGVAAARETVDQVAANYGVSQAEVLGPDLSGGGLAGGQTVVSRVTVRMPVLMVPLVGSVGRWSWTAVHAERVDDYRSFPQGP